MNDCNDSPAVTKPVQPARRRLLKAAGIAAGGAALSAPFIRNAAAAETTTWKVQTSWPAGVGLQTFKTWARDDQGKDRRRARVQAVSRPRKSSATSSCSTASRTACSRR